MKLNGIAVHRYKDTIFIPLPFEARRPIDGSCYCPYCKAHSERVPMWDTLAVSRNPNKSDFTWTCHYPELHGK